MGKFSEFLKWVQDNYLTGTNRRFVPLCELARTGQQPYAYAYTFEDSFHKEERLGA